jgi:hypothetical protein
MLLRPLVQAVAPAAYAVLAQPWTLAAHAEDATATTAAAAAAASSSAAAQPLPDDSLLVGAAVVLLILTGLLNLSLGDVVAEEASLPSTSTRINSMKKRRSDFIKGGGQ